MARMDRAPRTVVMVFVLVMAALFSAHAPAQEPRPTEDKEWTWVDARTLTVTGRAFEDAAGYERLPERFRADLPEPVWNLSRCTAGVAIVFRTDATRIRARWTTGGDRLNNMSHIGVAGLDLYARTDGGWSFLGVGVPGAGTTHDATLTLGLDSGTAEFMLHLPLYDTVASLEIGVPAGSTIEPAPGPPGKPVVVYGTSITQGASASRPGLCFASILSRLLGREVINLGFSATGRLDPGMVAPLAEIDAAVYILDCLPNLQPHEIEQRTVDYVTSLRALRPDTPVVLVDNIVYPGTRQRSWLDDLLAEKRAALRRAVERLGPDAVTLVEITDIEGTSEDESVDGIHPTDEGMRRHARRLEQAVRPMLTD